MFQHKTVLKAIELFTQSKCPDTTELDLVDNVGTTEDKKRSVPILTVSIHLLSCVKREHACQHVKFDMAAMANVVVFVQQTTICFGELLTEWSVSSDCVEAYIRQRMISVQFWINQSWSIYSNR